MQAKMIPGAAGRVLGALALATTLATPAHAEMSAEELAKLAQNPVGNLISLPFQNNTNFNVGPRDGTQNILNIQPVIPIEVNSEWNVITRTIMPVISQPAFVPGGDRTNGIGDIQLTAFLSPAVPKGAIWGRRRDRADANQQQRLARQRPLGAWPVVRVTPSGEGRPLGVRLPGEQRLVGRLGK